MTTEEVWTIQATSFAQQKEAFLARHAACRAFCDCLEYPLKTVSTEGKVWYSQLIALVPRGRYPVGQGPTETEAMRWFPYRFLHFEMGWNTESVSEPPREGVSVTLGKNEEDS